ncbi:hypothetical protein BE17_01645 [Sorangium cellulosum]|uniref:Uncharacterized protein n=1 Tax=Sorangium cellulosum TaxID=56 RepID=A0A150S0M4_SORCE|nr:hypothetical protein BE17_01645 [Sorangium cellulosum]
MLVELEAAGLDLGWVLTGAPGASASLAALSGTPELASVARVLADDLRQVRRLDQMTCSGYRSERVPAPGRRPRGAMTGVGRGPTWAGSLPSWRARRFQ